MYLQQVACVVFFFFSSRRRHTRFDCDWSSDVCSSDLPGDGGSYARLDEPELQGEDGEHRVRPEQRRRDRPPALDPLVVRARSEEHTSELQSQSNLVCRLLLEKKKKKKN